MSSILESAPGAGPTVALETAFLSSGLPRAVALETAAAMRAEVESRGARAAFVGVIGGRAIVGLDPAELEQLAGSGAKVTTRDLGPAAAAGADAGTTVAATVFLARRAGIEVVATGGIGGVHRGPAPDASADLVELGRTPVVLVCSGAKAVLDLPATMEALETLGVAVVGWGTRELPAFWSAVSGIPLARSVEGAGEVAAAWRATRELDVPGALVVCVPPPKESALPREEAEGAVERALADAAARGLAGAAVTPYLLDRVAELSEGRSRAANVALLARNAGVAAEIARALAPDAG